ncbi:MAG: MerR family transcriptional regulator [Cellvibrionaceae bacterium]|nr:MerR family transcriptional regulator [Motiliproteus sp.]MCW9052169.1 MerR family transcriptional regulator [Motiliproteus sp.]
MEQKRHSLSIGRLAALTHCNIETIRYYEKIELLSQPLRTQGGHRLYDETSQEQLVLICQARSLGFQIAEIRDLLCLVGGHYPADESAERATEYVSAIRLKIRALRSLQHSLEAIAFE